jgi:hypothetical protein
MNDYQASYDAAGAPQRDPIAEAAADLAENWMPDAAARKVAAAMLAAAPEAEAVVVPLVQPGKARGVWTAGQRVITVGAFFPYADDGDGGWMAYHAARRAAVEAGALVLAAEPGTIAYAVIERDGNVAVFEW